MNQSKMFQVSTRLMFGEGVLQRTGELVREAGVCHPMVITDPGMVATGMVDDLIQSIHAAGIESSLFDGVESDPGKDTVIQAAAVYYNHRCDGIIAFGGGSPIDCAKATGVIVTHPGMLDDYFGIGKVVNPLPVLFAIPSTVGTGSEVTSFSVISDIERHKKMVIGSPFIAPHTAILDPQVVASLPERFVAATGMDAMAHAVESVLSVFATPFSDAFALEAIYLVNKYLVAGVCEKNPSARAQLLYASTLAGYAFSNARTGLVHGMAHPIGSYHHVHHGLAIAIMLPDVMEFNLPCCSEKLARIAVSMGGPARPEAAIEGVRRLNEETGIPSRLSQVGVTLEHLEAMAQDAFESGNAQVVNPRKPTFNEVIDLYTKVI
jgi:alcohol dehydrogenase